jgi:hypothetical protein
MFNIFKTYKRSLNAKSLSLECYQRFLHSFTDMDQRYFLGCLRIGTIDWGPEARFLEPLLNATQDMAYTWELKFQRFDCAVPMAGMGWNYRPILIDLKHGKYQTEDWKKIPHQSFSLHPKWKLSSLAKSIESFKSPRSPWTSPSQILRVTENGLEITEYDKHYEFDWSKITRVHFSKSAIPMEFPYLEVILEAQNYDYRVELPLSPAHDFYKYLIARGHLTQETLQTFLNAEVETDLCVLSRLGELKLPLDRTLNLAKVSSGILCDKKELPWVDIAAGSPPLLQVDLAGIEIEKLEVMDDGKDYLHLPAKKFYFSYSKVNGFAQREEMMVQVSHWLKLPHPGFSYQFYPTYSSFLNIENAVFKLSLNYDRSAGFGHIDLAPEFYRKSLLASHRFNTNFTPTETLPIKEKGIELHSAVGFTPAQILPAPDSLHKEHLTFWKDDREQVGLTFKGYLYLFKQAEVRAIENQIADDWGERGGPYYETVLMLEKGELNFRAPDTLDLKNIKQFLNI